MTKNHNFRSRSVKFAKLAALLVSLPQVSLMAADKVVTKLTGSLSGLEIQKALDALPPGGEVDLGAGEYQISQPLLLQHDDETLRGVGPGTVLHLADNANCPVVILAPPLSETKHPVAHLHLSDLTINGNRQHQKSEFWKSAGDGSMINNNGVQVWNATDASVERVACFGCRSGGMVTASTRRLLVHQFDSYDNQFDGLACYQTEDCRMDGLKLHDNLCAGISLDLAFNHNVITNAALANNDLGIFMRYSRDNVFQDLNISKSRHAGIFMAQSDVATAKGWVLAPGTECTGNKFEVLNVNACGGKAFTINDASCSNNLVTDARYLDNAVNELVAPVVQTISLGTVSTQ